MPRKGGGGQTPPQDPKDKEEPIHDEDGRAVPGSYDRTAEDEEKFVYGDIVHDENQAEPDDLVVVNLPAKTADQWNINGGTLADQNPACPRQDDVVIVVLLQTLNRHMPKWDEREKEIPLKQLNDDGVPTSVYPGERLDRIQDSHLR